MSCCPPHLLRRQAPNAGHPPVRRCRRRSARCQQPGVDAAAHCRSGFGGVFNRDGASGDRRAFGRRLNRERRLHGVDDEALGRRRRVWASAIDCSHVDCVEPLGQRRRLEWRSARRIRATIDAALERGLRLRRGEVERRRCGSRPTGRARDDGRVGQRQAVGDRVQVVDGRLTAGVAEERRADDLRRAGVRVSHQLRGEVQRRRTERNLWQCQERGAQSAGARRSRRGEIREASRWFRVRRAGCNRT